MFETIAAHQQRLLVGIPPGAWMFSVAIVVFVRERSLRRSNKTIMAVGRERCNLNKTTSLDAYRINDKIPNSGHLCEDDNRAVLTEKQYSCSGRKWNIFFIY
jgi:hypothetical protein